MEQQLLTQTLADQTAEGNEEKSITEERLSQNKRRYICRSCNMRNAYILTCLLLYNDSLAAVDNKMAELMEELKYESEDYLLIT